MEIPFLKQSASKYKIETDVFEGPLDLLLQLIEKQELDINQLSLAKVTDQYLAHLQLIEQRDPLEVSAFLVIAAQLVLIKSRTLLPLETKEESEFDLDSGEALIWQLLEYKKYKEVSLWLHSREENNFRTYIHVAGDQKKKEILDLSDISLSDLSEMYRKILQFEEETLPLDSVVTITTITLKNRINALIKHFRSQPKSNFSSVIKENSKLEIIVTFLALLELIKNHLLHANQEGIFGNIELESLGDMDSIIETEL